MWKKVTVIAICVSIVGLLLGGALFSFKNVESRIENVKDSSNNVLYDISSISLFSFVAKDFFEGGTKFELQLLAYGDENLNPTGAYSIVYRSYKPSEYGDDWLEKIREEVFPLSTEENPISESEASKAYARLEHPLKPFLNWERAEYDGAFADIVNGIQYIAYIFGMIWGALSIILLIIIDTVVTAWELVKVGLAFIGLA